MRSPQSTCPLDQDRANLQASSMIKSELVRRISAQNPHLYDRDIEKVVNAILDECEASEPFQLSSEDHVKGATLVLVLPSRSQRKLFPLQDGKGDARAA